MSGTHGDKTLLSQCLIYDKQVGIISKIAFHCLLLVYV